MVEQLTSYTERKRRELPDIGMPALLDRIDSGIRTKGWDMGETEFQWIMVRVRARFNDKV